MGGVGSKIESAGSSVFSEVKNDVSSVYKQIGNVASRGGQIVDNVVQTGGGVINNAVNEVGGVVHSAENAFIYPLVAIGIGLAIFLARSDSNTISNVASSASTAAGGLSRIPPI